MARGITPGGAVHRTAVGFVPPDVSTALPHKEDLGSALNVERQAFGNLFLRAIAFQMLASFDKKGQSGP